MPAAPVITCLMNLRLVSIMIMRVFKSKGGNIQNPTYLRSKNNKYSGERFKQIRIFYVKQVPSISTKVFLADVMLNHIKNT